MLLTLTGVTKTYATGEGPLTVLDGIDLRAAVELAQHQRLRCCG